MVVSRKAGWCNLHFMLQIFQYGFLGLFLGFGAFTIQDTGPSINDAIALQQHTYIPETKAQVDSLMDASWAERNTNIQQANHYAGQALLGAEQLNYTAGIARSHYLLGITDQRVGSHEEAMEHFLISLEMEQERGDKARVGKVLNGIAILYYRQEDYESSITYFKRAVATMREVGNDERAAISTANIGLIYYYQGENKKALEKYNEALETFRLETDNKLAIHVTLSNIGNVLIELGEYEQAEEYHREALAYFKNNNLVRNESEALLNLSRLYYTAEQDVEQALQYARESLQKAKSISFKESIVAAYKHMANVYENEGDYEQALAVYKQFKATQDSLLNSERLAKIEEMETRFNLEEKNRQIELLSKEADLQQSRLARQKLWRYLLITSIVLLVVIAGLLYRYNNQKKRANAELESKKKQIERKNKQLMQLNEEKNEFMGMAAHDLRNPLSGIKSVISMIRFDDEITGKEIRDYLEIIDHSSDRMLILINNLLDVNAIEEGKHTFDLVPLKVKSVIRKAVQSQRRSAEAKDINIRAIPQDDIYEVQANPEALQRVLENLLSNAIKYSPSGSTIEMRTAVVADEMEIIVADQGPGIPSGEQDQLFTRFSQISTQPTANESSTGLGLFVVKNLMEKMNGTVRYDDEAGSGATFIIALPLVSTPDMA